MASAMGSWCVTVAPLMYWAILPATSSWSGGKQRGTFRPVCVRVYVFLNLGEEFIWYLLAAARSG